MQTFELSATKREVGGKKALKALRKEAKVPCIIYGGEKEQAITVAEADFRNLIWTPNVYIVNLTIDGEKHQAIIKDTQFHPVSGKLLHVDFLEIFPDKPVTIAIPVSLKGSSEGVKAGGKLQLEMRKLNVKGLIANLPDRLDIDITNLGLGKVIKVGALSYEGLEVLNAPAAVVVAVKLTRAARAAAENASK